MHKLIPLFHFSHRSILSIVFAFGILFHGSGGNLTIQRVKTMAGEARASGNEKSLPKLVQKFSKKDFANVREWYRSLEFIEQTAIEATPEVYIRVCLEIATKLRSAGDLKSEYSYLYKAQQHLHHEEVSNAELLYRFHHAIGISYYHFQRYKEAKTQYLLASTWKKMAPVERIDVNNTLGLINGEMGFIDSAKHYFERALGIARKTNNKAWIGVVSGNLGHSWYQEKNYAKARPLLELDYKISTETREEGSAYNALGLLIELDLADGLVTAAEEKLKLLRTLFDRHYTTGRAHTYYNMQTAVLEATANHKMALESFRIVTLYADTLRRERDLENIEKAEFRINFERKQAEVSLLQEKKKRSELLNFGLVGLTLLACLTFFFIIRSIARQRQREKELMDLRHAKVENELASTETEMRNVLSKLIEKNELVEQLTGEIEQFHASQKGIPDEEQIRLLDRLQTFTLLTDDDWLEFKRLFEKLNPGFFQRIRSHFPDLTNAELRLTSLIKLDLSTLEMSRVLGISPDSVRKTSLRLRKKLDMDVHEELVRFIVQL